MGWLHCFLVRRSAVIHFRHWKGGYAWRGCTKSTLTWAFQQTTGGGGERCGGDKSDGGFLVAFRTSFEDAVGRFVANVAVFAVPGEVALLPG